MWTCSASSLGTRRSSPTCSSWPPAQRSASSSSSRPSSTTAHSSLPRYRPCDSYSPSCSPFSTLGTRSTGWRQHDKHTKNQTLQKCRHSRDLLTQFRHTLFLPKKKKKTKKKQHPFFPICGDPISPTCQRSFCLQALGIAIVFISLGTQVAYKWREQRRKRQQDDRVKAIDAARVDATGSGRDEQVGLLSPSNARA